MKKRVVIAGSRNFNDYEMFANIVGEFLKPIREEYELIIVSGHCSGTDLMGERYAKENGFEVEIYPAEWKKYGRSAGPKRNKQMVDVADFAIAFPSVNGKGTQSMIKYAKQKGIPIQIYQISKNLLIDKKVYEEEKTAIFAIFSTFIVSGNNPMVGMTVAVAVEEASK